MEVKVISQANIHYAREKRKQRSIRNGIRKCKAALLHNLKIISIRDLITFREQRINEKRVLVYVWRLSENSRDYICDALRELCVRAYCGRQL